MMSERRICSGSEPPDFVMCRPIRNLELDPPVDGESCEGYRFPGIVDLHVHGGFEWDFSYGDPDRIEKMLDSFLRKGLTAVMPTLITCSEEQRMKAIGDIVTVASRRTRPPSLLGISLEGPFISASRRGSHEERFLTAPNIEMLERWQEKARGMIRRLTLAPELTGAIDFIAKAMELKVRVSIGHTDADHETTLRAFKAGAQNITHLFNAMRPFSHRDPTCVSAVFDYRNVFVELIADGIHVFPDIVRMTFSILGSDRISLVSDCVLPTGLSDGLHQAYGRELELRGGRCTIAGGHLFGGGLTLPDCFQVMHEKARIPLKALCECVSVNPCRAAGVDPPREDVILDKQFNWIATRLRDTWYWPQ